MPSSKLVTIGVPAYNAEAHLGQTVESLLDQSHTNIRVVISDNASQDGTRDIAESMARRDARVVYHRQSRNLGANPNYAALVSMAQSPYFKWCSSSDWCAPTFVARCLEALDADPSAVLAVPRTRYFTTRPGDFTDLQGDLAVTDVSPSDRFFTLVTRLGLNNAMNGVIRREALRRRPVLDSYVGADMVMMGYLALQGKFILIDEPLFYRRMEPETATALQGEDAVAQHHFPGRKRALKGQAFRRQLGWFQAVWSVSMPAGERLRALGHVARNAFWERRSLLADLHALLPRRTRL